MGRNNVKLTQEEAIKQLKEMCPEYDYSMFVYVNTHTRSIAVCPIHGEFNISRSDMKRGLICPTCSKERRIKSSRYSQEKAIKDMSEKRPEYDFSKFIYVNSKTIQTPSQKADSWWNCCSFVCRGFFDSLSYRLHSTCITANTKPR